MAAQWAAESLGAQHPRAVEDYAGHCAKCFDIEHDSYISRQVGVASRLALMRLPDWCTLVFASLIVSLCEANEMRDVQVGAVLRRTHSRGNKSPGVLAAKAVLWSLEALRRGPLLAFLTYACLVLVIGRGADAISLCLNAIAILFLLEVDNLMYSHGFSVTTRVWSEQHARPHISAEDQRVIEWSQISIFVGVFPALPLATYIAQTERDLAQEICLFTPLLLSLAGETAARLYTCRSEQHPLRTVCSILEVIAQGFWGAILAWGAYFFAVNFAESW